MFLRIAKLVGLLLVIVPISGGVRSAKADGISWTLPIVPTAHWLLPTVDVAIFCACVLVLALTASMRWGNGSD